MKAKQIRKLRKRIGKLQTYTIRETASLFGDFFGNNRMGLIMHDTKINASSSIRALEIYMKKYRKVHKQKNNYEREDYDETTEKWGRLMVIDSIGFKRFYM